MPGFEHYGQILDESNLQVACYQAMHGRPRVPMALFPMDGSQWLTELLDALQGHPLLEELRHTLAELLLTVNPQDLGVLAQVAESRPGHFSPDALRDVLFRGNAVESEARASLARALSVALLEGRAQASEALRSLAVDPNLRLALAPAWVVRDHAWAMQELGSWFSGEEDRDRRLLIRIVSPLSRGELLALAAEASAEDSPVPPAAAETIAAYVSQRADRPYFADRGDGVRWA